MTGNSMCMKPSDLDRSAAARHGRVTDEGKVMFGRVACTALVLALGVAARTPAQAANWFEKNFWLSGPEYSRDMPPCDYPPALHEIMNNFRTKEARFWNSDLKIVGIEDMRETAYLPLGRPVHSAPLLPRHCAHQ